MSEETPRYVYKEIKGEDLERATEQGWELVFPEPRIKTGFGPFFSTAYVVRRPFEKPSEMALTERVATLESELTSAQARVHHAGEVADGCLGVVIEAMETKRPRVDDLVDALRSVRNRLSTSGLLPKKKD